MPGLLGVCTFLAVSLLLWPARAAEPLPKAISDREFWSMLTRFSEPGGKFWENLVSNELNFVQMIQAIRRTGGVFVGVGPEQNFSYIAALRPEMAFIIDVRPENRNLHLLYKALFELSADRAEFVSRLFSLQRPARLSPGASVQEILFAFQGAKPGRLLYNSNLAAVRHQLVSKHGFSLSADDLSWIEYVLGEFYRDGPRIRYTRRVSQFADAENPSYAELMTATDAAGRSGSYLANEERFRAVRDLQARNLVVPIVGNFAGPKAFRAVSEYLRERNATVSVFYASNVHKYLTAAETIAFCHNLATLPHDTESLYIGGANGSEAAPRPLVREIRDCAEMR